MSFLTFLCSSVVGFLLISQTFTPRLTYSLYLSLSCTRYSRQFGATPKDSRETLSVSLKHFFLASLRALTMRQLAVELFLREAVIFNAEIMTDRTKLRLHQDDIDAEKRSPSKNFGLGMCFCHVMPRIFFKQVVWKLFSFFIRHWYVVYVSQNKYILYACIHSYLCWYTRTYIYMHYCSWQ